MRFGCFIPQGWTLDLVGLPIESHWPTMTSVAGAAEVAGFESGWVFDHFHTTPVATQEPTYEAWSLMAALAVATDNLRLGQMCTCNGYRPPAYLAHAAASIDVISGGRLEMGIGAGWYEEEFVAHGYEFPKPSVRIAQLDEGVEVMKRLWTEERARFEGDHYRLDEAICQPKPLQSPHIPLWVAGGGEQLTLRVVAKHGAYANFAGKVDEFAHKVDVLGRHCREVGRDFDSITLSMNARLVCAPTESEVRDRIEDLKSKVRPLLNDDLVERFERSMRYWSGTPEQIIEKLEPYRQAGLSYLIIKVMDAAYDTSGIELFGREVIGQV